MTETWCLSLTLPLPTSVNRAYLHAAGRVILSPEARAYRQEAQWRALTQFSGEPLGGDLDLTIHFYGAGDIDGRLKQLLDALNNVVWNDDRQILHMDVYQHRSKKDPHVDMQIRNFTGYPRE